MTDLSTSGAIPSSAISMAGKTMVTMYIKPTGGTHNNHILCLSYSHDGGATWVKNTDSCKRGTGIMTSECVATDVRAFIEAGEGTTSTADITLLAL